MIKNQMALRHNENIEEYVQYGILERVIKMKEDKKKEENKKLDIIKLVILTILLIALIVVSIVLIVKRQTNDDEQDDKVLAYTELVKEIQNKNVEKIEMTVGRQH